MGQSPWEATPIGQEVSPPYVQAKGSLPFSQEHTTGLYPEPNESNPHPHPQFL